MEFISSKFDELRLAEKLLQSKEPNVAVKFKRSPDKRRFSIESNPAFEIAFFNEDLTPSKPSIFARSVADCAAKMKVSTSMMYKAATRHKVNIDKDIFKLISHHVTIKLTVEELDGEIAVYQCTCENKDILKAKTQLATEAGMALSRLNNVYKMYLSL